MSDAKALSVVREAPTGALAAMTLSEVRQMAEAAALSGLFPGIRNKESAFTLMMLCQAEGLHPIQALRKFDIIDGKPALKADAMLAEYMTHGGRVKWGQNDGEACEALFTAPGIDEPVTVRWTIEMARQAGLAGKANWSKYPRQMLRARVISEGVRMTMPAVVIGIYTPEEVQDFDRDRPAYTPPPAKAEEPKRITIETVGTPVDASNESAKQEPPAEPPAPSAAKPTPVQLRDLNMAIRGKLGLKEDGPRLAWVSGMVGREVKSTKDDISGEEAVRLTQAAKNGEHPAERQPGEDELDAEATSEMRGEK